MMNSTFQDKKVFSQKLYELTPNVSNRKDNMQKKGFNDWATQNEYRTSYNDMRNKGNPVLLHSHYIPKYQGYIPGVKVETNTISKGFTKNTEEAIKNCDDRRFDPNYGQKSHIEYFILLNILNV